MGRFADCGADTLRARFLDGSQHAMDKKAKKRLEVIRQKISKMEQQLAGAKRQNDEPGEVERLEADIARLKAEATQIKSGGN